MLTLLKASSQAIFNSVRLALLTLTASRVPSCGTTTEGVSSAGSTLARSFVADFFFTIRPSERVLVRITKPPHDQNRRNGTSRLYLNFNHVPRTDVFQSLLQRGFSSGWWP